MIWRIFPFRREIKNAEQWTYHKYRPDIFQRGHLKMKLHICLLYNLCVDHLPHTDSHLSRPHYLFPSRSGTHSHKPGSTTVFFFLLQGRLAHIQSFLPIMSFVWHNLRHHGKICLNTTMRSYMQRMQMQWLNIPFWHTLCLFYASFYHFEKYGEIHLALSGLIKRRK